ncbi:hypothetical protein P3T76_005534 [Phytophthora citrophthora]|uniref:Transmembrane protein n=1 Tax=Phytophthora citrophthora TaxID=4793 RepID=A0AAD9GQJ4_9STRA|nr:hypothetical protein P3T76_005534 [Phytophthora citrophthora]
MDVNVDILPSLSIEGSVEPSVKLQWLPFLVIVLASNGALVGFMIFFLSEVTMGSTIVDSVGSSKNADDLVATYQLVNGYISAAAGEFINFVFCIFLVVIVTYIGNVPWPWHNPRHGRGRFKTFVLWWFTPFIMYAVNIGITAINIKSKIVGVAHIFVEDDLFTSFVSMEDWINDAQNTILRTAVRSEVTPFYIISSSQCLLSNKSVNVADLKLKATQSSKMPTVKNIDSLGVEYGFTTNRWNRDALPFPLDPIHSVNFTVNNPTFDEFATYQDETGFDFLTGYEMFLQGKTLFERSVSDTSVSAEYPCSWVDGKYDSDSKKQDVFATFDVTSEYAGMRKCNGAVSSLQSLASIANPSTHNLESFVKTVMNGMDTTLSQTTKISIAETTFNFETYLISRQLKVTMLTLDIPLDSTIQYQNTSGVCAPDGTFTGDKKLYTEAQLSQLKSQYCDPAYYVFNQPAATCGSTNCIFLDDSGVTPYKKQILLLPYLKDCSVVNMTYGSDYLNFLPHGCEPQNDSVFLYGSGAYLSGDTFNLEQDAFPYILNPRRHLVFSFAKLDWRMEDVSKMFNAECGVMGGCSGLVHELTIGPASLMSVLVVGNSTIPAERMTAGFINPVQLVKLNAPPMVYPEAKKRRLWEYLDFNRFHQPSWDKRLEGVHCSVLVDSYITQVERNHYYLDDPRQAMYTAALYYLFQDAATTAVTPSGDYGIYLGNASFAGDMERKKIVFSIPMSSCIATFVAIFVVVVFSLVVCATPFDRVKTSKEKNVASRYIDLLTNEEYPPEVHDCKWVIPGGDPVLMKDCVVESLKLHTVSGKSSKVFM